MQRTPLHVAAGTRASAEVIELLAMAHPAACSAQDDDGKTPLHLACHDSCELFEEDGIHNTVSENNNSRTTSYEVVRALVRANPLCAPIEDMDGMSALEHAILSEAPIKVVKLLQYATRRQCERECLSGRGRRVSQGSHSEGQNNRGLNIHKELSGIIVSFSSVKHTEESPHLESSLIPSTKAECPSRSRRGSIFSQRIIQVSHAA